MCTLSTVPQDKEKKNRKTNKENKNFFSFLTGSMALVSFLHAHHQLYPLYVELLLSLSPPLLRVLLLEEASIPNLLKVRWRGQG